MTHFGNPHRAHHHVAPAHSSSHKIGMQGARRLMKQHQAFVRQSIARSRATGLRMSRAAAARQNRMRRIVTTKSQRIDLLRATLAAAASRPLDCAPVHYAHGAAALLFQANWTSPDGHSRVIFSCNTVLPGSGRPASAWLWTDAGVEPLDLRRTSPFDATGRGRVFIFPSTVSLRTGESYAVRAAVFDEVDGGPLHLWSFATAGRIGGRLFVLGRGGLGTFIDAGDGLFLARPSRYDAARSGWTWAGRSSIQISGKVKLVIDALFSAGPSTAEFLVAPTTPGGDVVAFRCDKRDDRGDPMAIVDPRPHQSHAIIRRDDKLYLLARPNHHDRNNRPVFAVRATLNEEGVPVFSVPFVDNGEQIHIHVMPNQRDGSGEMWFIQRANEVDANRRPIILVPLEAN